MVVLCCMRLILAPERRDNKYLLRITQGGRTIQYPQRTAGKRPLNAVENLVDLLDQVRLLRLPATHCESACEHDNDQYEERRTEKDDSIVGQESERSKVSARKSAAGARSLEKSIVPMNIVSSASDSQELESDRTVAVRKPEPRDELAKLWTAKAGVSLSSPVCPTKAYLLTAAVRR